jgi:hypothetical protein
MQRPSRSLRSGEGGERRAEGGRRKAAAGGGHWRSCLASAVSTAAGTRAHVQWQGSAIRQGAPAWLASQGKARPLRRPARLIYSQIYLHQRHMPLFIHIPPTRGPQAPLLTSHCHCRRVGRGGSRGRGPRSPRTSDGHCFGGHPRIECGFGGLAVRGEMQYPPPLPPPAISILERPHFEYWPHEMLFVRIACTS